MGNQLHYVIESGCKNAVSRNTWATGRKMYKDSIPRECDCTVDSLRLFKILKKLLLIGIMYSVYTCRYLAARIVTGFTRSFPGKLIQRMQLDFTFRKA